MIRGGSTTQPSKDAVVSKHRKAKHLNNSFTNNTIILKEIELADDMLEKISSLKHRYFMEEPKQTNYNSKEKTSNIENTQDMARRSLDSVELEDRLKKLENKFNSLQKTVEAEFGKIQRTRHEDTETIINSDQCHDADFKAVETSGGTTAIQQIDVR
ncbi:unnamed protein product [Nippostrongylus brasiliensis]|uniref:Uncharacterized protein n=1 Tax=Nippostrongylus brasiliensis TaxID=27835 RepID=A0A0N4YPN6_NIPBR|nr:unnamed protein product [Nippostrongylus brasiliensis]